MRASSARGYLSKATWLAPIAFFALDDPRDYQELTVAGVRRLLHCRPGGHMVAGLAPFSTTLERFWP